MIADSSLSSAFDDLADLFLGGAEGGALSSRSLQEANNADAGWAAAPRKPLLIEGLVLGHLPMLGTLWASQYPRMVAASDNAPAALVRLDGGTARVELFHPPAQTADGRLSDGMPGREKSLPDRPCSDLAGALSRAAEVASRVIVYSSVSADELLLARSACVSAMAVLTGADDASAVGAYKAIKRLAVSEENAAGARLIRVAVMGSEDARASAAFDRLSDAAGSFLSMPLQLAGHCRQIAGGVPGTILFEGPSAMTTQAVLEALTRPSEVVREPAGTCVRSAPTSLPTVSTVAGRVTPLETPIVPEPLSVVSPAPQPVRHTVPVEAAAIGAVMPMPHPAPMPTNVPTACNVLTPDGISPLPIRCPFERSLVLAIDGAGVPQVVAAAEAGKSAAAVQSLVEVGAWLSCNRELLGMVCPTLQPDARPVLHLVTDRPVDVKRLVDSELRLHVRATAVIQAGTLALN